MRFYGSSSCENYGSVMVGPLSLRASEVLFYGNYDTGQHAGILTTLEVNLGVNIMCIKTLILLK
jgi:hypothetical protein